MNIRKHGNSMSGMIRAAVCTLACLLMLTCALTGCDGDEGTKKAEESNGGENAQNAVFAFDDIDDTTCALIGCSTAASGSIAIPTQSPAGKTVTRIESDAFGGCVSMTAVTVPSTVKVIGSAAFINCGGLTAVTIPSSVTEIGDFAFYGCRVLGEIVLPEGITGIGEEMFGDCLALRTVTIPGTVKSISMNAFRGCPNIAKVNFGGSAAEWARYRNYPGLKNAEAKADGEAAPVVSWNAGKALTAYDTSEGTLVTVANGGTYTPKAGTLKTFSGGTQYIIDGGGNAQLNADALAKLNEMTAALNKACTFNESLTVKTAYSQSGLPDYRTGLTVMLTLSNKAGTKSLYEATVTGGESPANWLAGNAWKYGFILRYPVGAAATGQAAGALDVYRYVGVPHAYYMTHNMDITATDSPCLETYLVEVSHASAEAPLLFAVTGALNGAENGEYGVYFVSEADAASAKVPAGATVSDVSGNGSKGYFVTVKMAPVIGA